MVCWAGQMRLLPFRNEAISTTCARLTIFIRKKLSFIILFSGVKVNYDGQIIEFIAFDAFYGSKIHLYHTISPFLHTFSSRISSFRLLRFICILINICPFWFPFAFCGRFLCSFWNSWSCAFIYINFERTHRISLFFFIRRFLLVEKRTLIQTFYFFVFSLSGDVPRNRRTE